MTIHVDGHAGVHSRWVYCSFVSRFVEGLDSEINNVFELKIIGKKGIVFRSSLVSF